MKAQGSPGQLSLFGFRPVPTSMPLGVTVMQVSESQALTDSELIEKGEKTQQKTKIQAQLPFRKQTLACSMALGAFK